MKAAEEAREKAEEAKAKEEDRREEERREEEQRKEEQRREEQRAEEARRDQGLDGSESSGRDLLLELEASTDSEEADAFGEKKATELPPTAAPEQKASANRTCCTVTS